MQPVRKAAERSGPEMHIRIGLPIALFVSGMALIAASVATGEARVSLLLVFPVFSGSGGLFFLGTFMIVLSFVVGFLLLMFGHLELGRLQLERDEPALAVESAKKTRYGGLVLVGPLPIAFGSDRDIAVLMLVLGIVLAIVLLGLLAVLG